MLRSNLLKGEKVRLAKLMEEDLSTLSSWHEDEDFLRQLDARSAFPKGERDFKNWLDQDPNKDGYLFAIRTLEQNALIGFVQIDGILWNQRNGWITLAIGDPAHRGQGYGKEAMQLILGYAFHELNLHRLQLTVFSYNERAIGLYESIGFQREGAYREFILRDGKAYDMYLYGLLRSEWKHR
jgi:RimJ/RimL family protein N-acetyltransferase